MTSTDVDPGTSNKISARSALLDYYSDRAVSFSGFFLASIFGLLTMMALVQGIECNDVTIQSVFLILSVFPVFTFAYMGWYVMKRFSYYVEIANKIEIGDMTKEGNGLRFSAALDEIKCDISNDQGKSEKKDVLQLIEGNATKQNKLVGKKIITSRWFREIYWILIIILALITYLPSLIK